MIVGELREKLAEVPGDWSVAIVGRDGERRLVTGCDLFERVSRYRSGGRPVDSPFRYVRLDSRIRSAACGATAAELDQVLAEFDPDVRVKVFDGVLFAELVWVEQAKRCLWLHHTPKEQA